MKSRSLDRKRIALGQKHEVAYIVKKAKLLIAYIDEEKAFFTKMKYKGLHKSVFYSRGNKPNSMSNQTIKRLARALLKALGGKK